MNKLYCIKFVIREDLVLHRNFWREELALEYMKKNPEWKFQMVENNDCHQIWEGR